MRFLPAEAKTSTSLTSGWDEVNARAFLTARRRLVKETTVLVLSEAGFAWCANLRSPVALANPRDGRVPLLHLVMNPRLLVCHVVVGCSGYGLEGVLGRDAECQTGFQTLSGPFQIFY